MRWSWIVLAAGCGRVSFDEIDDGGGLDAPAPTLTMTMDAGTLDVSVADRFSLRFAADHDWFAVDWRDASASQEPLAGVHANPNRSVVQGVIAKLSGTSFIGPGEGTSRTVSIVSQDATRLVFASTHTWTAGSFALAVRIENEIDVTGLWRITATVSSLAGGSALAGIELADSHVNDGLSWEQATAADGYTWRRTGMSPRATFRVVIPAPVGMQRSDEANNLYFAEANLTMPFTRTWTAVIWPPT